MKKEYSKDNPHKDIGKQKYRVRQYYTAWVVYDVIAYSKEEAEDAVHEHGGIEKIEWQDGYYNDDPIEVYANGYDWDHTKEKEFDEFGREPRIRKVAECIPYEDSDSIDYDDPDWSENYFDWKKEEMDTEAGYNIIKGGL